MPASCAGRCSWSTKMNGAEAMKAYIEVVAQPPPIEKPRNAGEPSSCL
jgi:hypothetical protein